MRLSVKTSPKVSVVIPTYNRKKDVLECLESVQKLNYPNYEIIVVDNGSTDKTAEAVKREFPQAKIIVSDKNLGVTGGRNLGARNSDGKYIFFLDHDTVVDSDALSELVTVMENAHEIGIAGPLVYYYEQPKRIWAAGTSINLLTGKISFNKAGELGPGQLNRIVEVQVLPTAFLVKREVIDKIGLFDDIYFAVYEDTDFCFRAMKVGYRIVCVSTAKVWHKIPFDKQASTVGLMSKGYYVARNRVIFMKEYSKFFPVFLFIFLPIYVIYYSIQALRYRKVDWLKNFLKGTASGIFVALKMTR